MRPTVRRLLVLSLVAMLVTGTTSAAASPGGVTVDVHRTEPRAAGLRLNDAQFRGTHNSTHRDPGGGPVTDALGWGYSHRNLTAQFEEQDVRQIELDVHYNWAKNDFDVYHVWFGDDRTTCDTLRACLAEIAAWTADHPSSAPIMVLVEPKDGGLPYSATSGSTRSDDHLPEDGDPFTRPLDADAYDLLDEILVGAFGDDRVLTPDDVTLRGRTLRESITTRGWPLLDRVRGQVLFVMDGGDHDLYTGGGRSLAGRAMFVQAEESSPLAAFVSRGGGAAKYDRMARLVAEGFMVRDLVSPEGFDEAAAAGAHYLSADFPEELAITDDAEAVGRCNVVTLAGSARRCSDRAVEHHVGHGYPVPADPDDTPARVVAEKVDRLVVGSVTSAVALLAG